MNEMHDLFLEGKELKLKIQSLMGLVQNEGVVHSKEVIEEFSLAGDVIVTQLSDWVNKCKTYSEEALIATSNFSEILEYYGGYTDKDGDLFIIAPLGDTYHNVSTRAMKLASLLYRDVFFEFNGVIYGASSEGNYLDPVPSYNTPEGEDE